jgi:hypothetical protein
MMPQRMMKHQGGKPEKGKEDGLPAVQGTPQGNPHQHQ